MIVKLKYGRTDKMLEQQVNEQGFTFGDKEKEVEQLHTAIVLLSLYEIINKKEAEKCIMKLHKKIIPWIREIQDSVENKK